MHRFMLCLGIGTALMAANACRARPDTPLTAAAARDDADEVRRILADGHTPDEAGDAWTALMWAARVGATNAMAVLLDAGADPNRHDRQHSWTPLLHAIHTMQRASVALLLERGADPNVASSSGGVTPLLMAADDPNPATVELLLAYGANPRIEGYGGVTPLTRAVSGGAMTDIDRPLLGGCRPATVRALLAHDPGLRLPNSFAGRQALWWARFHDCADVLALVEAKTVANVKRR